MLLDERRHVSNKVKETVEEMQFLSLCGMLASKTQTSVQNQGLLIAWERPERGKKCTFYVILKAKLTPKKNFNSSKKNDKNTF